MPETDEQSVPVGGRATLGCVGLLALVLPGLFMLYMGAWSGLVNPALPVEVRCWHVLEWFFARHWFVTFPCIVLMTGGTHLLVTAVMKRHRLVLNFVTAVVLTWVLIGLIDGLFLMGQIVR